MTLGQVESGTLAHQISRDTWRLETLKYRPGTTLNFRMLAHKDIGASRHHGTRTLGHQAAETIA